jgi:hypothetical protein
MPATTTSPFPALTSAGGLLPAPFLARVGHLEQAIPGLSPGDYHLAPGERLEEATSAAFNNLLARWQRYGELLATPSHARATSTERLWSLPVFSAFGYGWLQPAPPLVFGDRSYPISHAWGPIPVHLVSWDTDLDKAAPVPGQTRRLSPNRLLQEALDLSGGRRWGMLSNGRKLRLLRSGSTGSRASFVEFDLEWIFTNQSFADFFLAWLTCHQSRLEARPQGGCWLDAWADEAAASGIRSLDRLRGQVTQAISILGVGFLAHPANVTLRSRLASGALSSQEYYRQLLRLAYRLIFCFVAEDRALLHPPQADPVACDRYRSYYSTDRLRRLAGNPARSPHGDLWRAFQVVVRALSSENGEAALGLPALGGFLWSPDACPDLDAGELTNAALLDALRQLAYVTEDRVRLKVDYRHLGSEELGAIYESLLDLHPVLDPDVPSFILVAAAGTERKSTGSYYTHPSLVAQLLDSALDPLLDEAERAPDPEAALLALRICDPACGSGHFLVEAARRIAVRLARWRSGGEEPDALALSHASRQVIGRCIYGVDRNDMAVELTKVALWLEALEPGLPLSFLDHQIVQGDALLGATPVQVATGIPDEAFKPRTGDDPDLVRRHKQANRQERRGGKRQLPGFVGLPSARGSAPPMSSALDSDIQTLAVHAEQLARADDATIEAVAAKRRRWASFAESPEARRARLSADAWCLAFLSPKVAGEVVFTQALLDQLAEDPDSVDPAVRGRIEELERAWHLLHWHLAFPEIFPFQEAANEQSGITAARRGFDVVLGNPPWEKVKLAEKEFFSSRRPDIAEAAGVRRQRLIAALEQGDEVDRSLWADYQEALARAEATAHFLRDSGRYPLCGHGDVNTYAVFAEAMRSLVTPTGRVGVILPTGIATDDTTKAFFKAIAQGELVSLYDFENRKKLFPDVDSRQKFCLLTLSGNGRPVARGEFAFFCHATSDLDDPDRRFTLEPGEIALLNPNTGTCPVFHSRRDAEITLGIYQRVPVLIRKGTEESNPWGLRLATMFHMTNDSSLFRTREELEAQGFTLEGNVFRRGDEAYLPLYEGRMGHQFNHRFATQPDGQLTSLSPQDWRDPQVSVLPQFWVHQDLVEERLSRTEHACRSALLGFRRIACDTNERTVIASILPYGAASYGWILTIGPDATGLAILLGCYNSFAFDYMMRCSLSQPSIPQSTAAQLPVLASTTYDRRAPWDREHTLADWLIPRVLELTYTAWDLASFAGDLGYHGPPFRFDEERRAVLRAELDACFFHLYGIEREDVVYILDTFPIVARHDVEEFGEFRTKRLVLEHYDAMTKAAATHEPYECPLDPPPGDPRAAHPSRGDNHHCQ